MKMKGKDTWKGVALDVRWQRTYQNCFCIIDYCRIIPKLSEWSDKLVEHCNCNLDTSLQTANHGEILDQERESCCGLGIVSHGWHIGPKSYATNLLQWPLWSSMVLKCNICSNVGNNCGRPVKYVTDKAYGRTAYFWPIHTEAEFWLMGPHQQAVCIEIDKCNHKPDLSVENFFNNQIRKIKHCDDIRFNKVVGDGQSNWPYLQCLWDIQVFFFNIYTSAHNCGN